VNSANSNRWENTLKSLPLSVLRLSAADLLMAGPVISLAEESRGAVTTIEEIVVTAQKREESINDVGMSIQATTGGQLKDLGIMDAADIFKVVGASALTLTTPARPSTRFVASVSKKTP